MDYERADFHEGAIHAATRIPAWRDLPDEWRHAIATKVSLLSNVLPPGARVLDVGCGRGVLLGALREAGFATTGIEPSVSASSAARDAGHDVWEGLLDERAATHLRADAVILSHVLEHIERPREALRLGARIAAGGPLVFFQTNYRGWIPRIFGPGWAWVPEEHFWHFVPNALDRLLTEVGYRRRATEYVSLVQGNWKPRLVARLARLHPRSHDGFIVLYQKTEQTDLR